MSTKRPYVLNTDLSATQLIDAIAERIQKLKALVNICQTEDFTEFTAESVGNYFWLQSSLLEELNELFAAFNKQHSAEVIA